MAAISIRTEDFSMTGCQRRSTDFRDTLFAIAIVA
jgi:hypothetical protein